MLLWKFFCVIFSFVGPYYCAANLITFETMFYNVKHANMSNFAKLSFAPIKQEWAGFIFAFSNHPANHPVKVYFFKIYI